MGQEWKACEEFLAVGPCIARVLREIRKYRGFEYKQMLEGAIKNRLDQKVLESREGQI
jgi:hypothetical protein